MELTTEEKLDRLEAGLAEIGKRLDALEAEWREGLAQWQRGRERWAAEELAGDVGRWPLGDADDDEQEARQFSEALARLDMKSL
jgi:hypothetical protein